MQSGLLAARSIENRTLDSYAAAIAQRPAPNTIRAASYLPSRRTGFLGRSLLRTHWFVREVVLNGWFLNARAV